MLVSCPQCNFSAEIDAGLLPAGGIEGRCPRCRSTIPLGGWKKASATMDSSLPEGPGAQLVTRETAELSPEGRVSVINLIALLFLLDSILSLIKQVPILLQLFGSGAERNLFLLKKAYDTVVALAFLIAVFGLSARRNWARLAFIVLLSLGLFEGLYLLIDQHFIMTALEKGMEETLPDLHRQETGRLLGLTLYAFFIFKLNSAGIKARFN